MPVFDASLGSNVRPVGYEAASKRRRHNGMLNYSNWVSERRQRILGTAARPQQWAADGAVERVHEEVDVAVDQRRDF